MKKDTRNDLKRFRLGLELVVMSQKEARMIVMASEKQRVRPESRAHGGWLRRSRFLGDEKTEDEKTALMTLAAESIWMARLEQ